MNSNPMARKLKLEFVEPKSVDGGVFFEPSEEVFLEANEKWKNYVVGLSHAAARHSNHPFGKYLDVYMCQQNCMSIKVVEENLQTLDTIASLGDTGIPSSIVCIFFVLTIKKRCAGQKYVADFYVSDRKTGLRAMVKAGSGAKVATFVKPATTVNITDENKNSSPDFLSWLADRNLSSDDRVMRLKEGYIKEGNIVTVMGMLRRQDNILMIVPPTEPIQTTFQWKRCLLPMYVQGLVLMCAEDQNAETLYSIYVAGNCAISEDGPIAAC
ncbi:putative membrane protein [Drosera capensis]